MSLSQPPRNHGSVVPHDHAEIGNNDEIIRRVSEEQIVTVGGSRRLSSIAFQPSNGANGGMSIDIKKSIEEAGLDPKTFVITPRWIGSVIFNVDTPRSLGLQVGYDPIPENNHHGEVWGQFTKAKSKSIQRASQWFVAIPDVSTA